MKQTIIAILATFSFLPAIAGATAFFGPIYTCEFSTALSVPQQVKVEVYTTGLFSAAETIQIFYTFPDLNGEMENDMNFISPLRSENPDAGVYAGQMTNVSYLVDATLDLNKGELVWSEDGEDIVFSGACTEAGL